MLGKSEKIATILDALEAAGWIKTANGESIQEVLDLLAGAVDPAFGFIANIGSSDAGKGSDLVGFRQSGVGAVGRTAHDKLSEQVSVMDFGAIGDGAHDDIDAFERALATGKPVWVPRPPLRYKLTRTLNIGGNERSFMCDRGALLWYEGAGTAVRLSGNRMNVSLGSVGAPIGQYCIEYFDLGWSNIAVKTVGSAGVACIRHDSSSQTVNSGNNRWDVHELQAGGMPYGVKIDAHPTYILEGEIWDIDVILSATDTALVVGSAGIKKVRWNTYNVCIDASGITPLLVHVYDDSNQINLSNWQGLPVLPDTDVRFAAGTGGNILTAATGVQGRLFVDDNGSNHYTAPGDFGEVLTGGRYGIGMDAAASRLHVGEDGPDGIYPLLVENRSKANGPGKYVGVGLRGRDTIGTGKAAGGLAALPLDADYVSTALELYGRISDSYTRLLSLAEKRIHFDRLLSLNFADDDAAAAAGLGPGDLYHTNGAVRVKRT